MGTGRPAFETKPATVLLVTPPYHCGMVESAGVWPPLGLAYLAGAVRAAGFDPILYDAMSLFHSVDDIRTRLDEARPEFVATSFWTPTSTAAVEVLRAAKEVVPRVVTIAGGVHATFQADDLLRTGVVDYVVRGEGEATFPELLGCLRAGGDPAEVRGLAFRVEDDTSAARYAVVRTPDRPLLADLDSLRPAWDLIDWPLYHYRTKAGSRLAIVSWARGCTSRCTFCSQCRFWDQTWRPRGTEAILAELRMLRDCYGVDTVEVADEHPTRDATRWRRILRRLEEEDLGIELLLETRADDVVRDRDVIHRYREAGVLHCYVGVESVQQERLDEMEKDLRVEDSRLAIDLLNQAGIVTETSFLLGFPGDTPETVERTVALSLEYAPDLAFFLAVTPWPYSSFHERVAERVEVTDFAQYNFINPIIRPDGMTRAELRAGLSRAFMRFYAHRLGHLETLPPHKRVYLRAVTKLLMENSYLAREVGQSMAGMAAAGGAAATAAPLPAAAAHLHAWAGSAPSATHAAGIAPLGTAGNVDVHAPLHPTGRPAPRPGTQSPG